MQRRGPQKGTMTVDNLLSTCSTGIYFDFRVPESTQNCLVQGSEKEKRVTLSLCSCSPWFWNDNNVNYHRSASGQPMRVNSERGGITGLQPKGVNPGFNRRASPHGAE